MSLHVFEALRSRLVVSCQAYPGEPMRDPRIMTAVARAVAEGGAAAIRAQGIEDLLAIRAEVEIPIIGLVKRGDGGVFITPTRADCIEVARTGVEIVALDGTKRPRPDGTSLHDCIAAIHEHGALAMADCGSTEDATASIAAGADCVGTTLAGYTQARPLTQGPDFDLLRDMVAISDVPVLAEGRITTAEDAARALRLGAFAVVVGSAITHPTSITRRFVAAISEVESKHRASGSTSR